MTLSASKLGIKHAKFMVRYFVSSEYEYDTFCQQGDSAMPESSVREKLMQEIELLPDKKLQEIYEFIHYFRLGFQKSESGQSNIMKFAGCWNDMPEEEFAQFTQEIGARRKKAFERRKSSEISDRSQGASE